MNLLHNHRIWPGKGKSSEPLVGWWMKRLREHHLQTYDHCVRVALLADKIVTALGHEEHRLSIINGCFLHDLGKIYISLETLDSTSKLSDEEWEQIRLHPVAGYQLLQFAGLAGEVPSYVLHHHERWDGRGYPYGLRGEEIPFGARLCAVSDALDCMLTHRPYQRSMNVDQALIELQKNAGTQFDEQIVQTVFNLSDELYRMYALKLGATQSIER
ncbi:HD-GYP domain-containing protein [Paenibacillus sp. GCM10012307]|uniref:HD domain-containing protein n=1 Tax=Paenibacillus roseus TaxID=2798579 RepID=A0A934J4P3_9BACL|nr:HD domain-containing phosphohydrolase [Paenibacillus roseus]MBJ6360283.1 HD domain-containing protein [Paenibacillus roseus]